jgi:predicted dehydrogenase
MYLPTRWRSWLDFGTGVLGDHGPHYIDVIVSALGLEFPETVEADTDPEYDPAKNIQTFPRMATVRYAFPARGKKPPVTMTWHNNSMPPLPSYVKEDQIATGGGLLAGSKGVIVFGTIYSGKSGQIVPGLVKLLPEELDKSYKRPAPTLARPASHWLEWAECAKSGKLASTNFQYGGLVTQISLLGDIAIRNKGTILRYDQKRAKFINNDSANRAMGHYSRAGWELPT